MRTGGFLVNGIFYSAPSRLIGQRLRVHVYDDRIEAFVGSSHVVSHPRARGRLNGQARYVVNYRHVIHALKRKPQALANARYRDSLFPRREYADTWAFLQNRLPQHKACRLMVELLALAHEEAVEAQLAALLDRQIRACRLPDPTELRTRLARKRRDPGDIVTVRSPALSCFDALLETRP